MNNTTRLELLMKRLDVSRELEFYRYLDTRLGDVTRAELEADGLSRAAAQSILHQIAKIKLSLAANLELLKLIENELGDAR